MPLVVGALEENSRQHWNPAVQNLSLNVKKMFQNMDQKLYERCRVQYEAEQAANKVAKAKRQEQWRLIEEAATNTKQ